MPWTDPKSWADGDQVTAALMNTYARDNMKMYGGSDRPSVYVIQNATTSVNSGLLAGTNALFGFEFWDYGNFHSTSSNTDRLTVPSGMSGYYAIAGGVTWAANITGIRSIGLNQSNRTSGCGVGKLAVSTAGQTTRLSASYVSWLDDSEYVTMGLTQTSGGALTTSGTETTWLSMIWLGRSLY